MSPIANIFQPLIDIFEPVLVFFHDIGLGWGMAIVALTLSVRALLLPLAVKQYRSMRQMAEHMPELRKLQAKYKGDKQRLQQETMKFYSENKVNPLASCLPLVFQLPVFLALFYMLQADLKEDICGGTADNVPCEEITAGSADFLFIPDLTDSATGSVLIVLLVLYVGSQLLSTLLMPATVDKTQRLIFMALPFVFIPFILGFPAGLLVYWITTNLWTVAQQTALRKIYGAPQPQLDADGKPESPFAQIGSLLRGEGTTNGGEPERRPARKAAAVSATSRTAAATKGEGGRGGESPAKREGPPPRAPRKRKKRSGRRR